MHRDPGVVVVDVGAQHRLVPGSDFHQLERLAEWGVISAAAVGRGFLANPDLIDRLTSGAQLSEPDVTTFYAPGPGGYIDYPTLGEVADRRPA